MWSNLPIRRTRYPCKKHHPEIKDSIMLNIPNIISSPDYIGKNPKEPNSIELVKDIGKNTKVCVKLDTKNEYLYVASIFEILLLKNNLEKRCRKW